MRSTLPCAAALACLAAPLPAQTFENRDAMLGFLNARIPQGNYEEVIDRLDRIDEYTDRQIADVSESFRALYPVPFTDAHVLRERDMPGGFREEILTYWAPGGHYLYLYLFTHQAPDGLWVETFAIRSTPDQVFPLMQ